VKIHKEDEYQFKIEAHEILKWDMRYKLFFSVYYDKDDYVYMNLEDREDHIRDEIEVRRKSLNDNQAEAMTTHKQSLTDHYFMTINLNNNPQLYGL
jgi:hypothetical protein